jgi:hypothetical protein
VDTAQVAWLEANVPRPEALELFARLGALSRPEAVQLLPSLAYLEGVLSSPAQRAFVAPAIVRTPASADSMSRVASKLLTELATMRAGSWNRARSVEILNAGVASGGPFYWLGAAMARALVERDGPAAIGRALQSDGLELLRAHVVRSQGMPDGLLSPAVAEWVRALTDRR